MTEVKGTTLETVSDIQILQDSEYFKYIFKKTEKISCAVFYLLRSQEFIGQNDAVTRDLEEAAKTLSDVSLESLRGTLLTVRQSAIEVSHALLRLESKLRIAHAARRVMTEHLEVFLHELDSVHRTLRRYMDSGRMDPLLPRTTGIRETRVPRRERVAEAREGGVSPEEGTTEGRRERILKVLREKGEASIKDIVSVVTDCSEKTIQRELNALIKDNMVQREGERRWSKYKVL